MKKKIIAMFMIMLLVISNSTFIYAGILDSLFGGSTATTSKSSSSKPKDTTNKAEEAFDWWQENNGVVEYTLNPKATKFIQDHEKMFVGSSSDREKAIDYVDDSITWKKIQKDDSLYGDKTILRKNLQVTQINVDTYDSLGNKYTKLSVVDPSNNSAEFYFILYYGLLDDILEDDFIDFTGLPLGRSYFDNTSGGQTLVTVIGGCEIVKSGSKKLGSTQKTAQNNTKSNTSVKKTTANNNSSSSKKNTSSGTAANNKSSDYIIDGSDSGYYDASYFKNLSKEELRLARNEIYARHGRKFDSKDLQDYFNSKSWYTPMYDPKEFDAMQNEILNNWEKANRDAIAAEEKKQEVIYSHHQTLLSSVLRTGYYYHVQHSWRFNL